jgi:uncharacterized lipoprotein YddW (UPF0748 family)
MLSSLCFSSPVALAANPLAPANQVALVQQPILGVVRSADNAGEWREILARLEAAGLTYRVIEWNNVQRSGDFGDATVLFLPNVATITPEQLLGLQIWLNRGGRLIVSGAIGSQSSTGVQNALRTLLGAYWSTNLAQPQTLRPLQSASQRWVRDADTSSTVLGGVLVPTSLTSQPIVTWQSEQSSAGAAVIATQNSTFLGWRWGDPNASLSTLDSSWLRAAVSRFQGVALIQSAAATPPAAVGTSSATSSPSVSPAAISPRPEAARAPRLSTGADLTRLLSQTAAAVTSSDPADQIAPAAIDLQHSPRITLYEADTMRQELENVIGRYESALIVAGARATPASQAGLKSEVRQPTAAASIDDAVLAEARQGYAAFSTAMNQHDYVTARQQWLATRQLLWQNFPLDRPLSQPEVRAMWLDRGTIVQAGSRQGLERIFNRLAAAGINTVFFETVNAGYPIYPSQMAPAQNPLTQGWDPLADAVDLAHQRGIELHAWVWTFAAGNQAHNMIANQPDSFLGPVLTAHSDWANYDDQGALIPPGQKKPFLDPANPEARRYLLNLFEEIVSRYNIDGLQLDYIRYPFQNPRPGGHTYGYGMAARQQFYQLTGVDPITLSPDAQSPLWQQWTEFRTQQINSFVAETSRLVHRLKPNLIFSTAVFALPEQQRLDQIQQHWEVWARQGDVDMIVLMSYASDTKGLQRLTGSWLAGKVDLGTTLILPSIRLLHLSEETVVDQIQSLRDSASGGFALFAAENLNSRLQTIFHQTQGQSGATSEPIPYRQPFAAAASRYTMLLRQWNWLLETGQLQMQGQQLETWRRKTAALEQALQTLAKSPSQQTLQQSKQLLNSFRSDLKSWINLPALRSDYRVQTWQNQLDTLNKLLSYGERAMLKQTAQATPAAN